MVTSRIGCRVLAVGSVAVFCSWLIYRSDDSAHTVRTGGVFGASSPLRAALWGESPSQGGFQDVINTATRLPAGVSLTEVIEGLRVPRAVCFAPGTSEDVMIDLNTSLFYQEGPLAYFLGPRWSGAQGAPRALTWSFVPDGLHIPAGIQNDSPGPSELFSRMDSLFGGNRALWISRFEESFARWAQLTGLSYTRITVGGNDWDDGASWGTGGAAGLRGDVRISMRNIDGGSGVLAFNSFPSNGDMVIDRSENWASASNNHRFLRNVIMHEHGHGMGLFHVCSSDTGQLMEPFLSTSFDGPQHDDLRGAQRHYGDPFELDDGFGTATDLGSIAIGAPVAVGTIPAPAIANSGLLSIDAEGEQDWFVFTINTPRSVTITLTPQGRVYDSSPQNANGTCSSGNPIDSLRISKINVQLIDVDGSTVLATADGQPTGNPEILQDIYVPDPGTYFIRVYEGAGVATESQLYTMNVAAETPLACQGIECDDGVFCNGEEFCDDGNCFDGVPPCDPDTEACDEDLDICTPLPGACCMPDGSCEIRDQTDCPHALGTYYGNGTDCNETLDPPCEAVDTIIFCQLDRTVAFPGETVHVNLFVQDVTPLGSYQVSLELATTSGTGTLNIDCPDGARLNERICIDGTTFEPTGLTCDSPPTCPPGEFCVGRPDYVFANQATVGAASCNFLEWASALLDAGGPGVSIGSTPAYLGDATFEVSGDASANAILEIQIINDINRSFLNQPSGLGVPTRIGAPCVVTVLDPSGCNAPTVEGAGSRYLNVTPAPGVIPIALLVEGDPIDPAVSCVSAFVQLDGTLGPNPVFQLPSEWGTVHVRGEEILPSSKIGGVVEQTKYRVSAYCDPEVSPPTMGATYLWADVDNNTVVNFADIQLIVLAFLGNFNLATLEQVDLHDCVPNALVNFTDIQRAIQAFQGSGYASTGCPAACP